MQRHWLRDTHLGTARLQVRQPLRPRAPERDVTPPCSSLALFKPSCKLVGMLGAFLASCAQLLFVPFQQGEAGVKSPSGEESSQGFPKWLALAVEI